MFVQEKTFVDDDVMFKLDVDSKDTETRIIDFLLSWNNLGLISSMNFCGSRCVKRFRGRRLDIVFDFSRVFLRVLTMVLPLRP